jgi:uncharacterized protein (DUF302 family)
VTTKTTDYTAVRVTYDSTMDVAQTRSRFDERVPAFDPAVSAQLVIDGASWPQVTAAVDNRAGSTGLVALARLDQGRLLSLSGEPLEATLYLIGNPVIARDVLGFEAAATLYVPFRVAIYRDATGVHVSYDEPSSVLASLGSPGVDAIAVELDEKIRTVVEESVR